MVSRNVSPWLVSTASTLCIGVLGIGSSIVLSRFLGPEGRGVLTEAVMWPNLILLVGGLVNTQSVVYLWTKQKQTGQRFNTVVVSFGLSLVLAIVLFPIARFVNGLLLTGKASIGPANLYVWMIPVSLFISCLHPVFLAEQRFTHYWGLRVSYTVLYVTSLVVLGITGKLSANTGILALMGALMAQALFTVILFGRCFSVAGGWNWRLFRSFISYGTRTNMASLPNQLNVRLDQMLMAMMLSSTELGYYATAFAWSSMLSFLGTGISSVMLSRSASTDANNRAGVAELFSTFRVTALVLMGLALPVAVTTPFLLPALFGQRFAPSVAVAILLCGASVLLNVNTVLHEMVRGLGYPELGLRAELLGLVVTGVLLVWLLPTLGGVGAAVASLASYSVVLLLLLTLVSTRTGVSLRDAIVPRRSDVTLLCDRVFGPVRLLSHRVWR